MSEDHVFILLGSWLRLHYHWQERLPALAALLALPAPPAEADPAIRQQHDQASAEIQSIREEARAWGSGLDAELARIHYNYAEFAPAFKRCHAAYEPWIARLVTPGSLPFEQLAPALRHAAVVTQELNLGVRLLLNRVHPVPEHNETGFFAGCCFVGGIVFSVVFFNPLPLVLGLGLGMLVAFLGDSLSGHAAAVARRKQFEELMDAR